MAAKKKSKNLIPLQTQEKHYTKSGKWRMDKPDEDGYDTVSEYAKSNPQYVFHSSAANGGINPRTGKPYKYSTRFVGVHDPVFGRDLGASFFHNMKNGGAVARIGERKLK